MKRWAIAGVAMALVANACRREPGTPVGESHAAHSSEASTPPATSTGSAAPAQHEHGAPAAANHGGEHAISDGASTAAPGERSPPGYAPVELDPAQARAVGLRLAPVEERDFSKQVRTTGVVVVDETRTSHVHAKVRGWIEQIYVDFIGKRVTAGTPLCSIYSQEVLAAQLEFLSILDQTTGAAPVTGPFGDAEKRAREQLVSAARRRLALWDVPAAEIARLETTREPRRTFTLNAPRSGIVVAKQALAGMFIDPSVELYLISDIGKLWVLADVYASDLPGVRLGDRASLDVEGLGAKRISAEVAFLPPTVEESTRTLKVRFNLDNPDGAIRPGAFATVELNVELGRMLSIPEAAVIHAGRQAIVFVSEGEHLEPRGVELGPLVGGYYGVKGGVSAGEAVAVGAQFLIDSESRLRASSGKGAGHGGH
jgi:Cu(I)/Ag(I) efflux system membrane fusion protein